MRTRTWYVVAFAALVLLAMWRGPSLVDDEPSGSSSRSGSGSSSVSQTDQTSGLPVVDLASLPAEARDTLELIDRGGPFPYDQDDGTFFNYEGILPDRERGYYREYTVVTPGEDDRGARRIVAGADGELYWTRDHYQSFERIRR